MEEKRTKRELREIGRQLYEEIKERIRRESKNEDEWFYLNRFVYSRLQLDGRPPPKLKNKLFKETPICYVCKKKFESKKGVEIHRLNGEKGYSENNCVLVHKECHEKLSRQA